MGADIPPPRKRILILFAGTHLAYSPFVTQLYDALSLQFDVTVLAEIAPQFIPQKLSGYNVEYYEEPPWTKPTKLKKVQYFFLRRFNKAAKYLERAGLRLKHDYPKFERVKKTITAGNFQRIIAVDLQNLFYCSALDLRCDFLSLELGIGEQFLPFIKTDSVDCVITQSEGRYRYLFPRAELKKFFIPNSPVYKQVTQPSVRQGLLFGGTAWEPFGIYKCLDYLREYPEVPLTIQGAVPAGDKLRITEEYADLITTGVLRISDDFLPNDAVVEFFAHFEIGFALYNNEVEWIKHYNYQSAPSGKVFKYLAAGVPVLGIDIEGFQFIRERKCGCLITELTPAAIRTGIEDIRRNYSSYAANAITTAKELSFDKAVKPYIDFVKENTGP